MGTYRNLTFDQKLQDDLQVTNPPATITWENVDPAVAARRVVPLPVGVIERRGFP